MAQKKKICKNICFQQPHNDSVQNVWEVDQDALVFQTDLNNSFD